MRPWKKILIAAAILVMLLGAGGYAYAIYRGDPLTGAEPATTPGTTGEGLALQQGFLPGQSTSADGSPIERAESALEAYSPALFKLGFSFFAGFCMGFAARTFFRISLAIIGVGLLVLFGLQYAGLIDVNWSAWESHYQTITAWLTEQTASFRDFISGYLPSTASAGFGLIAGFKK